MNDSRDDEITFLDLVRILVQYKYVSLVVFLLTVGGGVASAVLSTPVYRAELIFAPAEEGTSMGSSSTVLSRLGGFAGLGLGRLGRQDKVTQGVATLTSQQFTREFIQEQNLLPILFADRWDAEKSEWRVESPEEIPRLSDAYRKFDSIRIVDEGDNSLITLAIEWTDPALAAEWANDLITRLNDKLRLQAIEEANETIEFLNKEVEKTRIVQLQQAIYFMLEEQINVRTMANIRQEFAFKVISPAIAPELDRYVSPNRPLIVILSAVLGVFLGILMSCLIYGIQRVRAELKTA